MPFANLAEQYAALPPLQPANYQPQPQQHIDLHAAMEEARRRDERWMQQMRNAWRNEQLAQEQLQQDEEEEERQRWDEQRDLLQRQLRLEDTTNNTSRQNIDGYQTQIINANSSRHPSFPSLSLSLSPPQSRSLSPLPHPPVRQRNIPVPRGLALYHEPTHRHSLGPMNIECP